MQHINQHKKGINWCGVILASAFLSAGCTDESVEQLEEERAAEELGAEEQTAEKLGLKEEAPEGLGPEGVIAEGLVAESDQFWQCGLVCPAGYHAAWCACNPGLCGPCAAPDVPNSCLCVKN